MKKLTNKERCKRCIHKKVCEYQSYFINTEGIDRCNNYSPKVSKGYRKQSEGGWIDNYNGTFTCTVCGGRASKMNYCGRCGAKMRKHEEVKDYPPYLDRPKMKGGAE